MKLLCKIFGHKLIEILKDQERFWDGEQFVRSSKIYNACKRCGYEESSPWYYYEYAPTALETLKRELSDNKENKL